MIILSFKIGHITQQALVHGGKGGIIVSDIKNWVNMWIERIRIVV